jgi:hypothetical protein
VALDVGDYDCATGRLIFRSTKRKKVREAYMHDEARETLEHWLDGRGHTAGRETLEHWLDGRGHTAGPLFRRDLEDVR